MNMLLKKIEKLEDKYVQGLINGAEYAITVRSLCDAYLKQKKAIARAILSAKVVKL